jgi:hypothetical protein
VRSTKLAGGPCGDRMHFQGYWRGGNFNAAAADNHYDMTSGNIQVHFGG